MNRGGLPTCTGLNRSELKHWHPVLPSRQLLRGPVAVRLHSTDIVLFRAGSGQIGALEDCCPHRRMRLSLGHIVGDKLMCKYHGWTFDGAGRGESPGTPKMHACASDLEAREAYGYIWVKSRDSTPVFPKFDVDGWCWMCNTEHMANAPLELTLDNFCEIEHTPTTHELFGYALNRMHEVSVRVETTDDTVTVINQGPAKRVNRLLSYFIGIKNNHVFTDAWTTYFSPVYSVYDHFWIDPKTGEEASVKWRVYVFFSPVHERETRVTAFTYAKSKWRVPLHGGLLPWRNFMRRNVIREIGYDLDILDGLASHNSGLEGMKLSRFDKALMFNRERIDRIYRERAPQHSLLSGNEATRKVAPASAGTRS